MYVCKYSLHICSRETRQQEQHPRPLDSQGDLDNIQVQNSAWPLTNRRCNRPSVFVAPTNDNRVRALARTHVRTHAHTHTHTHTHTRTSERTHIHTGTPLTHKHTHTHTHSQDKARTTRLTQAVLSLAQFIDPTAGKRSPSDPPSGSKRNHRQVGRRLAMSTQPVRNCGWVMSGYQCMDWGGRENRFLHSVSATTYTFGVFAILSLLAEPCMKTLKRFH